MLLRDYERKRGRAMLHFHALRDVVERAVNIERKPIRGERDADSGKYRFEVPLEPLSVDARVLVGDFVYNTRASLDYLMTALVRSTGKKENKRNQFPIWDVPEGIGFMDVHDWWKKSKRVTRQLHNTPPATRAAFQQLQPFYGVPATNPMAHPLFALMELSNRDKHRRLNLLAFAAEYDFIDAEGEPVFDVGPSFGPRARIPEPGEGEAYTFWLATDRDVDMYLLATYDIALHEPPELIGGLIETLTGINEFIDRWVLPTVKALL